MFLDKFSPASCALAGAIDSCSRHVITAELHQFAESLGYAIDAKDPHTSKHSDEVAQISQVLALTMGLSPREADIIHVAGHLHDIGKIGVPDHVLQKNGPLDPVEWNEMRKHPEAGAAIIGPVAALRDYGVVDIVLNHHERWDGDGYPNKIKGEDIPLGARIIAVADTLSAMLQNRPYRQARQFEEAYQEIIDCSETQFDPLVVRAMTYSAGAIRCVISSLAEVEDITFQGSDSSLK